MDRAEFTSLDYWDKLAIVFEEGDLLTRLVIGSMIIETYCLFEFYVGCIEDESYPGNNTVFAKMTLPELGCALLAKEWI